MSHQHLSSTIINKPKIFDGIIDYPNIFDLQHARYINVDLRPSIYLFLKQFDVLFPHIDCIKFKMGTGTHELDNEPDHDIFLQSLLDLKHCRLQDIHLRHVTRLDFGRGIYRGQTSHDQDMYRIKLRAEVLAHLISMPIQLIHLRVEQFEWFIHLIKYAFDKLRKSALTTVRHAEFRLHSCHIGSNKLIHDGKNLIYLLSTYTPYLQTLRLWRNDDFPWTSIRPSYKKKFLRHVLCRRWILSLRKPESIAQHVTLFEQNLCELVEQLKEFVYLDIYCYTDPEKILSKFTMNQDNEYDDVGVNDDAGNDDDDDDVTMEHSKLSYIT
ncbi:unnamed protein product [Rotaria socialis]